MKIGVPTEIKNNERRVGLVPSAAEKVIAAGHEVFLQAGAGEGAGFSDSEYTDVGVTILPTAQELYKTAEMIVKVKEPLGQDLDLLESRHLLFCYLHLAAEPKLVERLKDIGLTAVAFETVEEDGKTPLLAPMSAIAGRLATQIGTWYLHAPRGGRGVLMGGITGRKGPNVTVIGAGISGYEAASLAHNMGANVTIMDINEERLSRMEKEFPGMKAVVSTPQSISVILPQTDLLVGAVYVVGKKAPTVVTAEQIKTMPEGSVAVDISIDQGGCLETSRPCTHDEPAYVEHGVIHSAITNMPAAAPRTASEILSEAIEPYVEQLAAGEWTDALQKGVNVQASELKIELLAS